MFSAEFMTEGDSFLLEVKLREKDVARWLA